VGRREEVCGCGFSAERGLERVAPCAAVDVAVGCVSDGTSMGRWGECTLSIVRWLELGREPEVARCQGFVDEWEEMCKELRVCVAGMW
jgi:hypothetical protein